MSTTGSNLETPIQGIRFMTIRISDLGFESVVSSLATSPIN